MSIVIKSVELNAKYYCSEVKRLLLAGYAQHLKLRQEQVVMVDVSANFIT